MHRVVIDTNVLISGIIQKSGFPFKVVKLWEDEAIVLITSAATIEEAGRVLNYPKIRKKYKLTDVAGKADYIISGDARFLSLKSFRGIEIATPKEFCEIVGVD